MKQACSPPPPPLLCFSAPLPERKCWLRPCIYVANKVSFKASHYFYLNVNIDNFFEQTLKESEWTSQSLYPVSKIFNTFCIIWCIIIILRIENSQIILWRTRLVLHLHLEEFGSKSFLISNYVTAVTLKNLTQNTWKQSLFLIGDRR